MLSKGMYAGKPWSGVASWFLKAMLEDPAKWTAEEIALADGELRERQHGQHIAEPGAEAPSPDPSKGLRYVAAHLADPANRGEPVFIVHGHGNAAAIAALGFHLVIGYPEDEVNPGAVLKLFDENANLFPEDGQDRPVFVLHDGETCQRCRASESERVAGLLAELLADELDEEVFLMGPPDGSKSFFAWQTAMLQELSSVQAVRVRFEDHLQDVIDDGPEQEGPRFDLHEPGWLMVIQCRRAELPDGQDGPALCWNCRQAGNRLADGAAAGVR